MPGSNFIGTFASFFTNLNKFQRQELERAFSDAQNLKEFTNLESSVRLLKRKVDQRLPIPQPTTRPVVRGAIIEWPPLPDQRITFYEVDVSSTNRFAEFETFPTYGLLIVVDGLLETKFIRVRGVRRDGTTTPYSGTIVVSPRLFEFTSHTDSAFYIDITGTDPVIVAGGSGSDLEYAPINEDGGSKVWGHISVYADPAIAMFGLDHIFADTVLEITDEDGNFVSEEIQWRNTFGEFFNSQGIGPFTVDHPELGSTIQLRVEVTDKTTKLDGSARSTDSTQVVEVHLNSIELGV